MATSAEYRDFILDQLSGLDGIRVRAMMGEYVLYYRDRIVGGIYDDRLMVKDVPAARALLPEAVPEPPYPGARGLLPVESVDDRASLEGLFRAMWGELPDPKMNKRKGRA